LTEKYLTEGFVVLAIIVFVSFYSVIYISAAQIYQVGITPEGSQQANATYQEIQETRITATAGSIFVNNFLVSIVLVIPIAGLVGFLFVLFNTGQVIGLLAAATGYTPEAYVIATAIPIGLMEVCAYAILGAESMYVAALALNKNEARDRIVKQSWKSFILFIVILLVAAIVEAILIG
jgi:uncharacterized membrane protein SpoIIM required for sporulation